MDIHMENIILYKKCRTINCQKFYTYVVYVCVCVVCVCVCVCIYIYIYLFVCEIFCFINFERERDIVLFILKPLV